MFKKAAYATLGAVLLVGILYGSNLIPYAQTAFKQVKSQAQDAVPIEFQIDAARTQLEKIGPEIKGMVYQIAKEKAEIKRLGNDLESQQANLTKLYDKMMTLRNHVASGEEVYVATNGKAYTNDRVKEDLRHRFTVYQTAEMTLKKSEQVLDVRKVALEQAFAKLDEAQAQQRELEVQIENLVARQRMVEVAKTASSLNIDNSQLSKTREMIDEISSRIDTEEAILSLAPEYLGTGQIPVGDEVLGDTDILQEMDAYFNKATEDDVVSN